MSKTLKPKAMQLLLESFNWIGHVELPSQDMTWLAEQLSAALSGNGRQCENCNRIKPVLVKLAIGDICEDCLDDASEIAEEQRELQE